MSKPELVLYHYNYSPYGRRIVWYLTLRGIAYSQCMQPPVMPRPDVKALGINYRRIPLLAIGRDVYCDTRLILRKLEQLFPESPLGVSSPEQRAVEELLERWTVETMFGWAAQLIPPESPVMKDPKFLADRAEFTGRSWDNLAKGRPQALVQIRDAFTLLETTFLADGRDWILRTEKPALADIHAVYIFHWLNSMKEALPADLLSPAQYPKVFDWVQRFDGAYKKARDAAPKPVTLDGMTATDKILNARVSQNVTLEWSDPSGLHHGQLVEVRPMDSGFNHRDRGVLVGLNAEEIVIEVAARGDTGVHVHFPRLNFRLRVIQDEKAARL